MLNEDRIKLMTRMASYEENEGKRNVAIGNYFKSDYIGLQVMKSVVSATIAFMLCFLMYIFYDFEFFMQDIYKMDLLEFGKSVITIYLIVVAAYALITYIIYAYRYNRAQKSLKHYYSNLRHLSGLYEKESRR